MENEKSVVRASRAKFGKTLLGGFQVAYRCPRCKQELITNNNAIAAGDTCPHCQASLTFDDQIKEAFTALLAEKQSREAVKERIKEAKKSAQAHWAAEEARLAAEAAEQEARDRKAQGLKEAEREQTARREQQKAQHDNALNLNDAHAFLSAILTLGSMGIAFLLIGAFTLFTTASSLNDNATKAGALLITAVSAFVTLSMVYVFFRILGAIHTVLVMILDRLNSSSDRN